jgi:hypothetical protein
LLYQVEKDSLLRTIGWSDSTLQSYYEENPRLFLDSAGQARPFAEVRDDLAREWHTEAVTRGLLHRLAGLKQSNPVVVYGELLERIPVDAANDPRAISVYTVKKGGTFPHPAFPSIDPAWQRWE